MGALFSKPEGIRNPSDVRSTPTRHHLPISTGQTAEVREQPQARAQATLTVKSDVAALSEELWGSTKRRRPWPPERREVVRRPQRRWPGSGRSFPTGSTNAHGGYMRSMTMRRPRTTVSIIAWSLGLPMTSATPTYVASAEAEAASVMTIEQTQAVFE